MEARLAMTAPKPADVQRLYKLTVVHAVFFRIRKEDRRQNAARAGRRCRDDAVHTGVALAHAQRPGKYFADELPAYGAPGLVLQAHFLGGPADEAAFRHLRRVV